MKLTAEALTDYLACPVRHRYRHIKQFDPLWRETARGLQVMDERTLEDLFDKQMHGICYHIFNYIQDEKYPSEYILRQKWGNAWAKGRTVEDLMKRQKRIKKAEDNHLKYLEGVGLESISLMREKFRENPGIPLLVGSRVTVKIGKHEVETVIDLVREKDGKLELLEFNSGMNTRLKMGLRNRPVNLHVDHDITMTLASMALTQITGEQAEKLIYYDFISNREFETFRSEKDYKNLEKILDQVAKAMEADICYPVMNEQCVTCPFQAECRKGTWYD